MTLRASGGFRWTKCPASPRLTRACPDNTSDAAREGTCAAWIADRIISGGATSVADFEGETHPNGWPVDDEMMRHVDRYLSDTSDIRARISEGTVALWNGLCVGHFDLAGWLDDSTLAIVDLKYGHGVVSVDTPQLELYAIGLLPVVEWERVRLSIYQPRSAHPDGIFRHRWMTRDQVEARSAELLARALETLQPDSLAIPGDHCAYCPAAATCQALAATNYRAFDTMTSRDVHSLDADALATELDFLDRAESLLSARATAIRAEAQTRMNAGERIPGWVQRSGKSTRKWAFNVSTIGLLTGKDMFKRVEKSPAELEKEGATTTGLTQTFPTKARLAREDVSFVERLFNHKSGAE